MSSPTTPTSPRYGRRPSTPMINLGRTLSGDSITSSTAMRGKHPDYLLAHRPRWEALDQSCESLSESKSKSRSRSGGYRLTIHSKPIFKVGTPFPDSRIMREMSDQAAAIYEKVNESSILSIPKYYVDRDPQEIARLDDILRDVVRQVNRSDESRYKSVVTKNGDYSRIHPQTDKSTNLLTEIKFPDSTEEWYEYGGDQTEETEKQKEIKRRADFIKDFRCYFAASNLVPLTSSIPSPFLQQGHGQDDSESDDEVYKRKVEFMQHNRALTASPEPLQGEERDKEGDNIPRPVPSSTSGGSFRRPSLGRRFSSMGSAVARRTSSSSSAQGK
ncbi:hypothetical protein V865_006299 [Kwoniella europaea PYCC6329]|uniref:Uncharacterized protein n=1 Tax=Kwoniella europaea PYCC6329 TaxID=1423913 RepID=A0AAX4KPR2_9TREE